MKVSLEYIVEGMVCDFCHHYWIALIETDCIEIDGVKECFHPPEIQCPNCGNYTEVNYDH